MTPTEKYSISLGKRTELINGINKELWHIVSPDLMGRIQPGMWQTFIRVLKSTFANRLNWSLYDKVPVYEYQCTSDNLKRTISQFLQSRNLIEMDSINFEEFDYSPNSFIPGDIPDTHQQHLTI